jgi:hypothetical protein
MIKNFPLIHTFAALLALAPTMLVGQLRLDEPLQYADGELNTVSADLWRFRGTPYAEIRNQSIVVDYTQGRVFNGAYQRLWTAPNSREQVFASFKLTVSSAPAEVLGVPFAGVADVDSPDLYRGRVFMKRGIGEGTFRLGVASASALPENAVFFPADLVLNEEYLVISSWDNVNLMTRLYIDSTAVDEPRVQLPGGTARLNGFRRFGIQMNSANPLGRFAVRSILVGEDWASVQQSFTPKPAFVLDPPGLLLDERFAYAAGELIAVAGGAWRMFPSTGTAYAEVIDGALVVDHSAGRVFDGEYHRVFPVPANPENLYASFRLRVTAAPTEAVGFNFAGFADRDTPDAQRARVFMKRGAAADTFRIGLGASMSIVADAEQTHAAFIERDLAVGEDHLIIIAWDNQNLVARLYLNTDDIERPAVVRQGDAPRDLRRFAVRTLSAVDLGRYELRDLLVGENWERVIQPFTAEPEPAFYDDVVLGRHYYAGAGWVLWSDDSTGPDRGVVYVAARAPDGLGWVYHTTHGWLYLLAGSIDSGLFAYSRDLGWIFGWDAFGGDWFYRYDTAAFELWN